MVTLEDPRVIVTLLTVFVIIVSTNTRNPPGGQDIVLNTGHEKVPLTVVCVSDTHGLHKGAKVLVPTADWLIFAGDAGLENEDDAHDFNDWLGTLPHRQKIVVLGNMDFWGTSKDYSVAVLSNATAILMNTAADIEGYRVFGSPNTPKSFGEFHLESRKDAAEHWAGFLPQDAHVDILVTHGPPFGLGDFAGGKHVGDVELLATVKHMKQPPLLWVVGHIHGSYGVNVLEHTGGSVPVVNAAVAYLSQGVTDAQPTIVELPSGKMWRNGKLLRNVGNIE